MRATVVVAEDGQIVSVSAGRVSGPQAESSSAGKLAGPGQTVHDDELPTELERVSLVQLLERCCVEPHGDTVRLIPRS
jgi:hypothetical protein